MALSFINTSGNIISEDFCQQLLIETKADYVKSKSFGVDVKKIDEDIATTYELLRERWEEVRVKVLENQFDTTTLRERWIKPFLSFLGFDLVFIPHNLKNEAGIEYHIPYRGWNSEEAPLIHMVHSSVDLDIRDKNSRTHPTKSPHDILQQYLNNSRHKWAILINGKRIRVLRDFYHSITKGFIEFDIEGIFETANTEQFRILYRILHRSRFAGQFESKDQESEGPPCLLERFHLLSRETGVKVGENLRKQVRIAIETLGNGFAENLNPDDFAEPDVKKFYSEILNIIYRLLFLLFAEQKGWLPVKNDIYARTYSVNFLRERAARGEYHFDNNEDLWEGLKVTFMLVTKGYSFPNGDKINAFGGQLFSDERIYHIKSPLKNKHLLKAIDALCFFTDKNLKNKINYAALAIDELGSVYESLLDYEPRLLKENTVIYNKLYYRGEFILDNSSNERKTTGSYYSDSRLVAHLIDSTLLPVIENSMKDKTSDEEKRKAILDLKIADISCGSGTFLIAALEKMGEHLAIIGLEEGEKPTEDQLRQAKRTVLQNCIYGVDLNPMAVGLAKFSLWITASMPNLPLSFLDHKIKCGNSLVGATSALIEKGIPVQAFNPVTLDNKEVCSTLKKEIKKELEGFSRSDKGVQTTFKFKVAESIEQYGEMLHYYDILNSAQTDIEEVENVTQEYEEVYRALRENTDWKLADTWTSAFFIQKSVIFKSYPTNITLKEIAAGNEIDDELENEVSNLASKYNFFHWHLEFPEVFEKGGFDCILGNPPWERIKLQSKEFFTGKNENIHQAKKKQRDTLIQELAADNPSLFNQFIDSKVRSEKQTLFLAHSNRYPLLGNGDINSYCIFTELVYNSIKETGRIGLIVPSDIATGESNKDFFQEIISKNKLISLYDFINKNKRFFANVHPGEKFCLLTIAGQTHNKEFDFVFNIEIIEDINNTNRHFTLTRDQFTKINPNTKTCPIFLSKTDADIIKKIYENNKILVDEKEKVKYLDIHFIPILDAANESDSKLLLENTQITRDIVTKNKNRIIIDNEEYYPVYEGKMIDHYNHRAASVFINPNNPIRQAISKESSQEELSNTNFYPTPQYWVNKSIIDDKLFKDCKVDWCIGIRKNTAVSNSRTFISTILPKVAMLYSFNPIFSKSNTSKKLFTCLACNLSSFTFDYIVRNKLGGENVAKFVIKQLPVIPTKYYSEKIMEFILSRAIKLFYVSEDLEIFANDIGYFGNPYNWDKKIRFMLKAELDAIFGHLYCLSRNEFEYILDSFPIIKRKDMEKYKTYHTKDTILKIFDEMLWVKDEMGK